MAFEIAFLIGRIIVGLFYIMGGVNHFRNHEGMVRFSKTRGLYKPRLLVPLSGVFMILGGLSLLLGKYVLTGVVLLNIFLFVGAFKFHNFWKFPEDQRMTEMSNFMRNAALFGANLMFLVIEVPWALSL